MIPTRLRLHDFLSHADTDLDLSGIHAAVLTGHNGAGKSSILDAITWGLWGSARSSGDEVIRVGQPECLVEVTIAIGGDTYRIQRRRSAKRNVATQLELHHCPDPSDPKQNVALTGAGVRDTQARINALIGMDYDTFCSTAFLGQGKSDAFTAATPKERKVLLGEILGLSRFDVLAQACRDRARAATQRADLIEESQAELRAAQGEREPRLAQLTEARAAVDLAAAAAKDAEEAHAKLQAEAADLRAAAADLARAEQTAAGAAEDIAAIDIQLQNLRGLAAAEAPAEALAAAEAAYADWQRISAEEAEARTKADAWQALEQKASLVTAAGRDDLHHVDLALMARDADARAARATKEARLTQALDVAAARASTEESLAGLRASLAELAGLAADLEATQAKGHEFRAERDRVAAERSQAEQAASAAGAKLTRMDAELGAHEDGATCPLCASTLTGELLARLREQLQEEQEERLAKAETLAGDLVVLDSALLASRETYTQIRSQLALREDLQRQEAAMALRLTAADEAAALAETLTAELAAPPAADAEADRLRAERAEIAAGTKWKVDRLQAELAAIGHDAEAYAALRQRLASLAGAPARWNQLQQARQAAEDARAAIAKLEGTREGHTKVAGEAAERAGQARTRAARLADCQRELMAAEVERTRQADAEKAARTTVTQIEARIAQLDEDARRIAEREAEWQGARNEARDYQTLATAYGRNGIQAHIIETAIPEIEEEANSLLARISDNRMRVQIVTQRDKKAGGVAETLEIRIADDAGERNYEMFSGGEAFRVNFALRLALSRLLARRAGARLQTLVIDEGFGTQDEQGRQRLVEAINAVSGEYSRILVVTHIRELRDLFTTQIEVSKRHGISSARLSA